MTRINRRNCLKVFAGSVLGVPAALAGETAESETLAPVRPRQVFFTLDGCGLLEALSEARDGERIVLCPRTYDCSGHELRVPPGVRLTGAIGHSIIRCLEISGGHDSKVSSVWIDYSDPRVRRVVGPDLKVSDMWIEYNSRRER